MDQYGNRIEKRVGERNPLSIPNLPLNETDLLVMLLASRGNNPDWEPDQAIQISGNNTFSLPHGWRELVEKRYTIKTKGNNIILYPKDVPDHFRQLIEKASLDGLGLLIDLVGRHFDAISSITLQLNTSLGINRGYRRKINGVTISLCNGAKKSEAQQLLDSLKFPWGRTVLVGVLKGIGVDDFVLNFTDGGHLIPSSLKFGDFFYDEDGLVYVVLGGGSGKTNFNILGSKREIRNRLETIYSNSENNLLGVLENFTREIGGGVGFEIVTSYPYVGYDLEQQTIFSGYPAKRLGPFLFNPHPESSEIYCIHERPLIGLNPQSLVAQIVGYPSVSPTIPLSRVADFGL